MAGRPASAGGSAAARQRAEESPAPLDVGLPPGDLPAAKPRPDSALDPEEEAHLSQGVQRLAKKNIFVRALDTPVDGTAPSSPWGAGQAAPPRRGRPPQGGAGSRRAEPGRDGAFLTTAAAAKGTAGSAGSPTSSSRAPSPGATPSRTPGGGRARRAPGTPGQGARRKGLGKPTNPFIEYEDREVKLQQERKWLEQDSVFMRIRREGMRHQGATARSFTRSASDASLYENRTMFGNYSVQLRRNKALRDGFMGSPSGASSRTPLAFSGQRTGKSKMGDHPHLKLLKMLQLTMEESTRSTEECIKQAGLGDDSQELQDASPGARPASATVSSGTRARPGPSGRAASAGTRRHRGDAAR